jgi:hypothetical protein
MMGDLEYFPGVEEIRPSQYETIVELQHDLTEREEAICELTLNLRRVDAGKVTPLQFVSAVTLAFLIGWMLNTPLTPIASASFAYVLPSVVR